MKKTTIILIMITFSLTACKTKEKVVQSGKKEKEFVDSFLKIYYTMSPDQEKMKTFIAPSFIKANDINISKALVNNYLISGHSIDSYMNGIVIVKIWGEDKKWVHKLVFEVVKENRDLYLMPSKFENNYIHPWKRVDSFINE